MLRLRLRRRSRQTSPPRSTLMCQAQPKPVGRVVSFLRDPTKLVVVPDPDPRGFGKLATGLDATVVRVDLPVRVFSFDPSLVDGGTVLTTSAQISAGFTNGLSPISFTEPAGTDINTLASSLNSALISAG